MSRISALSVITDLPRVRSLSSSISTKDGDYSIDVNQNGEYRQRATCTHRPPEKKSHKKKTQRDSILSRPLELQQLESRMHAKEKVVVAKTVKSIKAELYEQSIQNLSLVHKMERSFYKICKHNVKRDQLADLKATVRTARTGTPGPQRVPANFISRRQDPSFLTRNNSTSTVSSVADHAVINPNSNSMLRSSSQNVHVNGRLDEFKRYPLFGKRPKTATEKSNTVNNTNRPQSPFDRPPTGRFPNTGNNVKPRPTSASETKRIPVWPEKKNNTNSDTEPQGFEVSGIQLTPAYPLQYVDHSYWTDSQELPSNRISSLSSRQYTSNNSSSSYGDHNHYSISNYNSSPRTGSSRRADGSLDLLPIVMPALPKGISNTEISLSPQSHQPMLFTDDFSLCSSIM